MQISNTKTYACYLIPLLILLLFCPDSDSIAARTFTSVISGGYDTPGVWDLGSVPGTNDTIIIDHDIVRSSGIGFGSLCELTVNADATLRIDGSMINAGKIYIYGSIDVFGNAINNGEIYIAPARKLEVLGDFTNNNLITNDGICIVMGVMVNNALADGTGHYDVCGTTTNNGHAEPTLTLCQICGEKYTNLGTGTYTELCGSLPVELGELTAEVFPGSVRLNWTTLSENQTSHFIVERALLDGEYEAVAR